MTGSSLGRFVASLCSCGLQPTNRVAVALSGGPDSLALASMAVWWQRFTRQPDAPLALIVDHKLRPESSEEARAVAAQATAMGMEARVLTVEWPACAPPALGDKMVAAREARYALLLHACAEAGRSTLLLAHHADDQAETFLLRLMHASGVAGLACMPRVADKRAGDARVRVVRPLLEFHKAELEAYCRRGGLPYVTDPTNAELSFHRHAGRGVGWNRVRHVLQAMPAPPPEAGPHSGVLAADGVGMPLGGSSSSMGQAASAAGGGASAPIVHDILRLQRHCEAAMLRQQDMGEHLLRRAVLHASVPDLPNQAKQQRQAAGRQRQRQQTGGAHQERQAERRLQQRARQPWFVDWGARLELVAQTLQPLPFALVDARCFGGQQEAVGIGALSRLLRAVSGRKYPAPLAQTMHLHELLAGGRLDSTFTGGGCQLKRLSRCKGRYVLCVPQQEWGRTQELLAALPPLTEQDAARERQREAAAAAAAAAALESSGLRH